jgi:hypothetical protein
MVNTWEVIYIYFWQKFANVRATWKVAQQQLKGSIKKIQKNGVQSKNPQY